jgi:hypothetical protein
MLDAAKLHFNPEMHLRDGRVIGTFADAIAIMREHESRPGVDDRDEVLHRLERAQSDEQRAGATKAFIAWAKELDLLAAPAEPALRPF